MLQPFVNWQHLEQIKVKGMMVAGNVIQIFYVWYHYRKVHKLVHGLCPNNKMSCIGKYKRNVLDYQNTAILSIMSSLFHVISIVNKELFSIFKISPAVLFSVDSISDSLFYNVLPFCLTLVLINSDLPSSREVTRPTQFYVRRPEVLVPRLPITYGSNSTLGLQLEQGLVSFSGTSKAKYKSKCKAKGQTRGAVRPPSSFHQTSEWTGLVTNPIIRVHLPSVY